MTGHQSADLTPILFGSSLGEAFDQLQDKIRERAYHIFLDRDEGTGDSTGDWLLAQSELLKPIELEIKEQKTNVVAECNLKGFSPGEIEIEVENGLLKVFGSHRESSSKKIGKGTESHSESVYFFQSVELPAEVNLDESHAKLFKNGKLKVILPKVAAPQKARRKAASKGKIKNKK
jgi:HSP20 family molecular chaperone IbpA